MLHSANEYRLVPCLWFVSYLAESDVITMHGVWFFFCYWCCCYYALFYFHIKLSAQSGSFSWLAMKAAKKRTKQHQSNRGTAHKMTVPLLNGNE